MEKNFNIGAMKAEAMAKAFGVDIEKGRTGVYQDNAENRRLNRVGQSYGHKKEEEAPKGRQGAKQEEGDSAKRDGSQVTPVAKHAEGASDEALKRAAADPKAAPEVKSAAEAEMKKRGSGEGDGGEKGKQKVSSKREILKDFKRISSDELWNRGYDAGDAKEIYFKSSDNEDEIILINEDGSVAHDKVNTDEGDEDLKEYKSFDEFASANGFKVEKDSKELEQESKEQKAFEELKSKTAKKAKSAFIKYIKDTGGSMQLDAFMNEHKEHYADILKQYGADSITGLGLKLEEKYADSDKDPYGEKLFTRIYDKCMNSIPADVYLQEVENWPDMDDFVWNNEEYFEHKLKK